MKIYRLEVYEFAWNLQYQHEGPYDLWIVHDE